MTRFAEAHLELGDTAQLGVTKLCRDLSPPGHSFQLQIVSVSQLPANELAVMNMVWERKAAVLACLGTCS